MTSVFGQRLKTSGMGIDKVSVHIAVLNHQVDQAIEQIHIAARPDRQIEVGKHRRLGLARVADDQFVIFVLVEMMPEDGVIVGDIRTDQKDRIGLAQTAIRSRRAVRAKALFVTSHCRAHAQRGIAVVIARAKAQLH